MMSPRADFDWTGDDAVVLPEQPATAVYINQLGAVVIRQERSWDESEDAVVVIQPENARMVALAILGVANVSAACLPDETAPILAGTGADRQRRYRQRHRNGGDATGVTRAVTGDADNRHTPSPDRDPDLLSASGGS